MARHEPPGALCWTGGRASLPATKERCVSVGRRLLHALSHYRQHPPNWSQPRRGWASRKKYAEGALTRAPPTPAGANTGRRRRLDARRPGRAGGGRLGHGERSGCGGRHRAALAKPMAATADQRLRYETTASEHGRVGCGWLLFEYRQRRQSPDTSSRRDGAVDCRTAWVGSRFAPAGDRRFSLFLPLCRNL